MNKKFLLVFSMLFLLLLAGCSKNVDLNKYVTIKVSGQDGSGKAEVVWDTVGFEKAFADKEYTEEGYLLWYGNAANYIQNYCVKYTLTKKSGLSNGDVITLQWECKDRDVEDALGLTLVYSDIEYTVEGLEEDEKNLKPTATSTPEPTATSTPEPTATSTPEPTATSTPEPTATSTPEPTATSTPEPTATSTPEPTATSTPEPTATSTPEPTATSTPMPTATSTPTPTPTPTPVPCVHEYDEDYVCKLCGYMYYTKGLEYKDQGKYYSVVSIGTAAGNEIIIPREYKGKPVKEIGSNAFKNSSRIVKLVIPSTITKIGENAFFGLNSLEVLEYNAEECETYKTFLRAGKEGGGIEVVFGEKVTEVPKSFLDSSYTKKVTFKGTNVKAIGDYAFYQCSLKEINFPEGLETIGNNAFSGCGALANVELKEGLKQIGEEAFYGCKAIEKLVVPSTVTTIGENAFFGLNSLEVLEYNAEECETYKTFLRAGKEGGGIEVVFGEKVTEVPKSFLDSSYTKKVTFKGTNVKAIGDYAFYQCSLKEINFPEGLETIGNNAFSGCGALANVELKEGLKQIGEEAFYGCKAIEKLVVPSTVTTIGENAFFGLNSLEVLEYNAEECETYKTFLKAGKEGGGIEVVFGEKVTEVPKSFLDSSYTKKVTFKGTNVKAIGDYAFYQCSLKEINFPEGLETIGNNAFGGCGNLTKAVFVISNDWYADGKIVAELDNPETAAEILTGKHSSGKTYERKSE